MDLGDFDLTVADLDLGSIDAEADYRLNDYFVTAPYVASALRGRRVVFLGRKGSGKSALFRQLPRLAANTEQRQHVLLVTPDVYAWSALKQYTEQGLLPEHAHTNAWRLTLAIEIAGALLQLEGGWLPAAEKSAAKLRRFLQDNFGTIKPDLLGTATSIIRGLKSFNVSAFGFGAGMEKDVPTGPSLSPAISAELFRHINVLLDERRLVVGIDRLDDSWDGSEDAKSLLIGLLKASKDLNDTSRQDYTVSNEVGLRVLIFLRSDIYDDLRFDDKDKHRSNEQAITWTPDLLHQMVTVRLPGEMTADDLMTTDRMRGGVAPFTHLVKRTFLRPREILQFLDECIRQEDPSAIVISKEAIRRAEDRYSRWKVDDLIQEYQKVFPKFGQLLDCLRQEKHRYDTIEDLGRMIEAKKPELVATYGTRKLLETLFDSSVIGVRINDAGSTRFKSEDSELVLPHNGALYVHLSLFRGLNIREARKANEVDTAALNTLLYPMMIPSSAIGDLTFCNTQPKPVDVVVAETFDDCGSRLGIHFWVEDVSDHGSSLRGDGQITQPRLEDNRRQYESLRAKMLAVLDEHGASIEAYSEAVTGPADPEDRPPAHAEGPIYDELPLELEVADGEL